MVRRLPLRLALGALALAAVLALAYAGLRDSRFVRVTDVYVVGLRSDQQDEIRAKLRDEALDMTTLHVREDALRAVVEGYPQVASVSARPDFPHGLTIDVRERIPVAVLGSGHTRVAVSGGGTVLAGLDVGRRLTQIDAGGVPAGPRVTDPAANAALAMVAAAPEPLRRRLVSVGLNKRKGLVGDLRNGPDLVFGSTRSLTAKWRAAARVLADSEAVGATYVDVRVPGRAVAGGVGPSEPSGPSGPSGPTGPTLSP